MKQRYPIYTVDTECHDCYKCVRQCPVKAIKIKEGRAEVLPELCIACGHCVEVCPSKAKHVRNDINRTKNILNEKKCIISLAPSFRREFTAKEQSSLISAFEKLGFYGVSETALGAEQLSRKISEQLSSDIPGKLLISSACPAATNYIAKYLPFVAEHISTALSPAQIHGKMLKEKYGKDIAVIFVGPCPAKKMESDQYPELLDIALTFSEIRQWFKEEHIIIEKCSTGGNFLMANAGHTALYPIEAGMIRTIKARNIHANYIAISGIEEIKKSLADFNLSMAQNSPRNTFIEVLACKGSCIKGPCISKTKAPIEAEIEILDRIRIADNNYTNTSLLPIPPEQLERRIHEEIIKEEYIDEAIIRKTLLKIGKQSVSDEINCGGCGYQECRTFARAIIQGKAEPAMCLSFLRKQAQQKANALMHHIPAGLVLIDKNLQIIESNTKFADLFRDDLKEVLEVNPSLKSISIDKIIPLSATCRQVLHGEVAISSTVNFQNKIFDIIIFSVSPHQVIGGFFQDVTNTEMKHEEISNLAQEVIHKNLQSVQEIACKLGENMAETEILLRTLVRGFSSQKLKKLKED